jgi:hypothetical protein
MMEGLNKTISVMIHFQFSNFNLVSMIILWASCKSSLSLELSHLMVLICPVLAQRDKIIQAIFFKKVLRILLRLMFIPRLEKYKYPIDEDYRHFLDCEIRKQGRLNDCGRCKYVWDHWYGTDAPYNMTADP